MAKPTTRSTPGPANELHTGANLFSSADEESRKPMCFNAGRTSNQVLNGCRSPKDTLHRKVAQTLFEPEHGVPARAIETVRYGFEAR